MVNSIEAAPFVNYLVTPSLTLPLLQDTESAQVFNKYGASSYNIVIVDCEGYLAGRYDELDFPADEPSLYAELASMDCADQAFKDVIEKVEDDRDMAEAGMIDLRTRDTVDSHGTDMSALTDGTPSDVEDALTDAISSDAVDAVPDAFPKDGLLSDQPHDWASDVTDIPRDVLDLLPDGESLPRPAPEFTAKDLNPSSATYNKDVQFSSLFGTLLIIYFASAT